MSEWLYVIELAPSGRIKVGRTDHPARRVGAHIANAAFGGGEVARMMLFACPGSRMVEQDLIAAVEAAGGQLAHGRESFAGVTFMAVVAIADDLTRRATRPTPGLAPVVDDLLDRVRAVVTARAVSLDLLRELLADPTVPDNATLGTRLRKLGLRPTSLYCPDKGRTAQGIRREWLTFAATA